MNELMERKQKVVAVIRERRGLISAVIYIALIAVAVIAVQRAWNYGTLEKENKKLQTQMNSMEHQLAEFEEVKSQLAYSEEQVNLLQESTNALTAQVSDLNALNEALNSQLEELLNIKDTVPVITRQQLQDQLASISELVSQKYMYRNATRKESDKAWLWWGWTMPLSDASLLATYDGTIKAGIDLKDIKLNVNESNRTITVDIPDSKILDHNIPQETINVLEVKNSLFNKISFNDYNRFISAEKDEMEKIAIERGVLTEADKNAKEIIKTFLQALPGMDTYNLVFK